MFDRLAPGEIAAKLIGIGARRGDALLERCTPTGFSTIAAVLALSSGKTYVRSLLLVATASCLLCAGPAFAQVEDPLDPLTAVPSLGITSPLGIGSNGSVGTTGIPLGSTEVTSLGVSPAPTGGVTGTIAITSSGTTCSTVGTSSSGMYGSTATYDGGGTASGSAAPATAANSGTTANSGTSTSSATSVTLEMPISSGTLDTSGTSGMCGSGSSSIASSSM